MLRFIKHHLASEDGAAFYGMFSLMIFVIFFLVVLLRIWKMKKATIDELGQLPFENDDNNFQNEQQ
jgi:cytochrome c oxidase cbb3-type subunit IV